MARYTYDDFRGALHPRPGGGLVTGGGVFSPPSPMPYSQPNTTQGDQLKKKTCHVCGERFEAPTYDELLTSRRNHLIDCAGLSARAYGMIQVLIEDLERQWFRDRIEESRLH